MTKTVIHGKLTTTEDIGSVLGFYSVHQNIQVYLNGKLTYEYPVENNNLFSDSPGYCWNFIDLPYGTNNLEIIIKSPYSSYLKSIPTFYIGNELSLPAHIITSGILPFMLCVFMFMFGLIMIIYQLALSHNVKSNGKLMKLGVFSMFLAVWSINECNMTTFLLRNNIVTSYISFLSLMMLPYPFAVFVQTFYEDNSRIWNVFYKVDLLQILYSLVMLFTGLYDLRRTLWTTHAMLIFIIFIVVIQSYLLIKDNGVSYNVKVHMVCTIICAITLLIDLIGYYFGLHDNSRYGRIGFLVYIIVLGMYSMKESLSLIKKGQEASTYQKLAYTDQMTGLNNRTCFNLDFETLSQKPDDVAVIDFDLNNLKRTNDTLGHSAGDRYIKTCSGIIYEIFNGIGKCYRVGGDEFVTLVEKASTIDMTQYLAMLESSVDAANRENKDLKMQIAYGCTVFDPNIDKNLEDTYNRADKIMYKDKENKKTIRRR
jgi:diguanylate cyclase (GGDEF)-like protein